MGKQISPAREGMADCMRTAMVWTLVTAATLCGAFLIRMLGPVGELKTVAVEAMYLVARCTGGVSMIAMLGGMWIGAGDFFRG